MSDVRAQYFPFFHSLLFAALVM
jgi:hypothetical protein